MERKRVMIVDDDREFIAELKEALELSGYDAVPVDDSNRAIESALKVKPDVVLLDLKMPNKSGFEVAAELKRMPQFASVPIIAMSACYKDGDFSLLRVNGIVKYLSKPFDTEAAIAEISMLLGS